MAQTTIKGTGTVSVSPPLGVSHGSNGPVSGPPSHPPTVGRQGTGSNRLDALVKALEDVTLEDQHDLHRALEAFRMLGHRLAMEAMVMGAELEAGINQAAKNDSVIGVVGFSARRKIKRTLRAFRTMAEGFASAGASAVTAWGAFEKDFAEDLAPAKTKPSARKGFRVNPN